ncbi:cell filamentation protein Fic [Bacteroidia bacterium]|nr:cell filamentation protein Fic [Bacteroidia bacterium]
MKNTIFFDLLSQFEDLNIRAAIDYEKMNKFLISHHSTAIEGSSLTLEEVQLLLAEGTTAQGKPLNDHNMVKDHQAALEALVAMAKRKEEITPQFIQNISAMVMKTTGSVISAAAGTFDSSKGDWRKLAVSVGTHYFISYQKVEREVKELCAAINVQNKQVTTPLEVYDLAFDAHFGLVSIHPFADGNGRTSRLLMNYILAYHDLPLAVLYNEDKLQYYAVLKKNQEIDDPNYQEIRDFMYAQQIKYLSNEIKIFTEGLSAKSISKTFVQKTVRSAALQAVNNMPSPLENVETQKQLKINHLSL